MKHKELSDSYLSALCMELAMLLKSGITISDGILMLIDDEPDKNGKMILQNLLDSLYKGESFSSALRQSGHFPRFMINMTEVGEKTGRLVETLTALSDYYNRREQLTASIWNAVTYPLLLLVIMTAVVLILIIKVLPIFNDVFNRLGTQMSSMALNLMRLGEWLKGASLVIAVIIGAALLIAFFAWLIPVIRATVSNAIKNVFGGRGIFDQIASSRFVSAMTLAITSSMETEEAITMASSVSGGSKAIDLKHKKCLEMIRSGSTLSEAMYESGIISARNSRMLSIGSRSGMSESAMAEIAARSDRNVQERIEGLVGRIEPALVIISSVMVGIILFSVMLPLISIMTALG